MSKEALNIDGLGKKVIEQFWDLNLLKEPADIFNLDFKKVEQLEGWGKLSINNMKIAINKSRLINLDRFIYSLGIRHIGKKCKNYGCFFGSIEKFEKVFADKNKSILKSLHDLDGIGRHK